MRSLLLFDFYVTTEDPEGFIEDLDELCQNYAESEEGYYFDYEYSSQDSESFIVDK